MQILFPIGNVNISSFENTFNAKIAKMYIITAAIIATIVANFSTIIPLNKIYMIQSVYYRYDGI